MDDEGTSNIKSEDLENRFVEIEVTSKDIEYS